MRDLKPLCRDGGFPIRGKACPTEAVAEGLPNLRKSSRNVSKLGLRRFGVSLIDRD